MTPGDLFVLCIIGVMVVALVQAKRCDVDVEDQRRSHRRLLRELDRHDN